MMTGVIIIRIIDNVKNMAIGISVFANSVFLL